MPPTSEATQLLIELKAHHTQIVTLVTRVQADVSRGDLPLARARLRQLHELLDDHHALERLSLFPPLLDQLRRQPNPALTAAVRASEAMLGPMEKLLASFFRRFAEEMENPALLREWKQASTALVDRLHAEEMTIFPLFERELAPRAKKSEAVA